MKHILLPKLIDCHVHFREPGYEHKATMLTEAAAARAGGIGTVCEMPNTDPPTTTIAALADKVRRAAEVDDCDIRFFFGATKMEHLRTLRELWTGDSAELCRLKGRCCGLKAYFDHSTGNQGAGEDVIEEAFKVCGELGIPLVAHCEDKTINDAAAKMVDRTDVAAHSLRRPPESEVKAIEHAIGLTERYGTPFHVAHLSTKEGLNLVRHAKARKLPVTCEVAPHHLFLSIDDYDHLGTLGKMNPPLRSKDHVEALWTGIMDGTVDCIATDHAPHTLEEKQSGEPLQAPSGVPGVETTMPLLLSVALDHWPSPHFTLKIKNFKFTIEDIQRLCFTNPNRIFNLDAPAEPVLEIDTDAEWVIHGKDLHSKCEWTPYEGWRVKGKIVSR